MKEYFLFFSLLGVISCKTSPHSDRDYDKFDPNKIYKLTLNPTDGSAYHYEIINESKTEVEINDKKIDKESKSTLGVVFRISKDSLDNFLFNITYDKVHLYSKNGDEEIEADADNAAGSLNPLDKMLGVLKGANMVAILSSSGEMKAINGYQDLGDKIISTVDPAARDMIKAQWEKQIGDNLVKNNMDQLFKVFPDSAVHLRDHWTITSKQEGEMPLLVKNIFTLKAVNSDIAVIAVQSTISHDNTRPATMMGMPGVSVDLKGSQEGEFEMETKTGMLINGKMKAKIDGNISVMGKEVPVSIKTSVDINGHRL